MKPEVYRLYRKLVNKTSNPIGVCALLANIRAESSFRSNDVEAAKSKSKGWTDESYTEAVDSGTYTKDDFIYDKYGYGLCQWTWWERKKKLYEYCKNKGVSISDVDAQIEFMLLELKKYTTPYKAVFQKDYASLEDCTKIIMLKYEAPADQSEKNQEKRVKYARELWDDILKMEGIR